MVKNNLVMGAINSARKGQLSKLVFATTKGLSGIINHFQKKRAAYMQAVLTGNTTQTAELEIKLFEQMGKSKNPKISSIADNLDAKKEITRMLQKGFPIQNALTIALLNQEYRAIENKFIPGGKYRTVQALTLEKEIHEQTYHALGVALKKARALKLTEQEKSLTKEMEKKLLYSHSTKKYLGKN